MSGTITTTPVVLVVSPSLNTDGRKAFSTRGQLFDGRVGDRLVVKRSTAPLCDAARVLLAEGVDPATGVVMRPRANRASCVSMMRSPMRS
jgi:hypothetical protein